MVIEPYSTQKSTSSRLNFLFSDDLSVGLPSGSHLKIAWPLDRIAAFVVDILMLLIPFLIVILAPIKRQMMESLIFETQLSFVQAGLVAVVVSSIVILLYYILLVYFLGSTLGMRIFGLRVFDIWTLKTPSFKASLDRALGQFLECCLLGLPWLALFSNRYRRVFHDRLSDTIVVSLRGESARPPTLVEAAFVHGFLATLGLVVVGVVILSAFDVLRHLESNENLSRWLEDSRGVECDLVSEALQKSTKDVNGEESRLQEAMALFASGIIDKKCLEQEANLILYKTQSNSSLAYLAKAFVNANQPELSNEYLDQVCKISSSSEPCQMAKVVESWSDENWQKVATIFSTFKTPLSNYVSVWKLRYDMKMGFYKEALDTMLPLNGEVSLVSFLVPERIRTLQRMGKISEAHGATQIAYETLPLENRINLAGWMCYEELSRHCQKDPSLSCSQLTNIHLVSKIDNPDPHVGLAMSLMIEGCEEKAHAEDYLKIKSEINNKYLFKFYTALEFSAQGDILSAKKYLAELSRDSRAPEALKSEALRRLMGWADGRDELHAWLAKWQDLQVVQKFATATFVLRLLKSRGENSEAFKIGRELFNKNKFDLDIARETVLVAFHMGQKQEAWHVLKEQKKQWADGGRVDSAPLAGSSWRSPSSENEFAKVLQSLKSEFGDL